jgi:hypothetical protein
MALNWLKDVFAGKAIEETGKIIDNLSTSSEEKAKAKNEITQTVLKALEGVVNAQRDVLLAELGGSKIQRLWRPVVMLAFALVVFFHYFIYPLSKSFNSGLPELPLLDSRFWDLLEIGLGGYVIGRSVEKIADTVTKNADLPFLRKKERRQAMNDTPTDTPTD